MANDSKIKRLKVRIDADPKNAELYQELGKLYVKGDELGKAKSAYEKSLALDPSDAWTHLYLGNWHYHGGEYDLALSSFLEATELIPDHPIAFWCAADMQEKLGNLEAADAMFKQALALGLNDDTARSKHDAWLQRYVRH